MISPLIVVLALLPLYYYLSAGRRSRDKHEYQAALTISIAPFVGAAISWLKASLFSQALTSQHLLIAIFVGVGVGLAVLKSCYANVGNIVVVQNLERARHVGQIGIAILFFAGITVGVCGFLRFPEMGCNPTSGSSFCTVWQPAFGDTSNSYNVLLVYNFLPVTVFLSVGYVIMRLLRAVESAPSRPNQH
jgi:hypothetical protein